MMPGAFLPEGLLDNTCPLTNHQTHLLACACNLAGMPVDRSKSDAAGPLSRRAVWRCRGQCLLASRERVK